MLLAINAKYVHSSLSVWVLAEAISRNSLLQHDVTVIESTINQSSKDIANLIAFDRINAPNVIGISTYIWNAQKTQELLAILCTTLPDTIIILGGPEASHNADYWIGLGADYVVHNEGEQSLPALLDALERDLSIYTDASQTATALYNVSTGKSRLMTTDAQKPYHPVGTQLIDPYTQEYLDTLKGKIAYLETSRGCPYRCTFCLSGDSTLEFFPMNYAKRSILKLANSGARTIKLVDRTFNCNVPRAYDIFEFVIGLDADCCFHFEVAADLFDEKTIALLQIAPPGRIQLEAGLQSFYKPALDASARTNDLDKAQRNIRALLQGKNIHLHIDLIAGLPHESLQEFRRSFNLAYALQAHTLQLGFLKMLHGSVMRKNADIYGICYTRDAPYEIISSPWLSSNDLQILKSTENALQHTYNKARFLITLEYVLSVCGLDPFTLFERLGVATPSQGLPLDEYATRLYGFLQDLPGVDADMLQDYMTCDWLMMVKGKNMPSFLKRHGELRKRIAKTAGDYLGRTLHRDESTVLLSGKGVYVDSTDRDPVTGLYKLHYIDV